MIPSQGYVAFNLRGSRKQRPIASLSLHAGCGPLVNKENLPKNQKAYVKIHLRACLHGDGGPQAGEVNCLCGIKNNPPLHAILQTRHPGVHFLKIIEWSLTARKQEKYWQTTCFDD